MAIKINAPIETAPTMEQMMPSSTPAAYDIELRRLAELNNMDDDQARRNPEIRQHLQRFMETVVQGADAPIIDRKTGKRQSVSIGAPGFETINHFAAILRWQGPAAHSKAVRELFKRDPKKAKELELELPQVGA